MPSIAPRLGRFASLFGLAVLVGLALSASASAEVQTFEPIGVEGNELIFDLEGVPAEAIKSAKVKARRSNGSVWRKRIKHDRVRRAARSRSPLRIRVPAISLDSRLTVRMRRWYKKSSEGAASSPPAEPPSIDPEPGEPCGWGTFGADNFPGACWRPYGDSSPFNTPVGSDPSLVSNSTQIVDRITGVSPTPHTNEVGTSGTSRDYSHPIYFSKPSDPLFTLRFDYQGDPISWGTTPDIEGTQIRIPDAAIAAAGSDHHMTVIDQASGYEYGFWDVRQKPQGGGILRATSGGRTRIDGNGLRVDATAAYFAPAAGMIRPAELESGEIDHALFMTVKCTNGNNVYPADPVNGAGARCSNQGSSNTNAPALGQHLYLDMTEAEINALPAPAWKKTMLRAMAEYGMYIGDTGGSGWGVMFESGSSYTSFGYQDPWVSLAEELGLPSWDDPESGRTLYNFKLDNVVDWGSKLKVPAPRA